MFAVIEIEDESEESLSEEEEEIGSSFVKKLDRKVLKKNSLVRSK